MSGPASLAAIFAELRDRIGHWRRHAMGVDTDLEADFAEWFGLRPAEARLLATLYLAGGRPCPVDRLADAGKIGPPTVSVRVFHVRSAMEAEAIDSAKGQGYWLTDVGMAECKLAIEALNLPPVGIAFEDAA